ncbi:MAG: homoserine dehydrogenase [Lachnospiraceae bacterium]|nr:homoserine dehydrogenase [Lachnospiraceae bacterium]
MKHVSILGYGTVGSGVAEVLSVNRGRIREGSGVDVQVSHILDLRDFPGDINEDKIVHDINDVLNDPDTDIVVETMGGTGAAYEFTKAALEKGICVCTSNKALVAAKGPELMKIAGEHGARYLFEASVGGGIPILRVLKTCLTADEIDGITGILNGTTNYILTAMEKEGREFNDVLKEAQDKGFAERDPSADVDGFDAARKIAILASLVTGKNVDWQKVYTEGISEIQPVDFKYAKVLKRRIKLLGAFRKTPKGACVAVSPFMIPCGDPLSMVDGVFNAISVDGNMLGESMYYGQGAGMLPTASAVSADVVDLAVKGGDGDRYEWSGDDSDVVDFSFTRRRFFVRVSEEKKQDALKVFRGTEEVGAALTGEYAFITTEMSEKSFDEAVSAIGGVIGRIRLDI